MLMCHVKKNVVLITYMLWVFKDFQRFIMIGFQRLICNKNNHYDGPSKAYYAKSKIICTNYLHGMYCSKLYVL